MSSTSQSDTESNEPEVEVHEPMIDKDELPQIGEEVGEVALLFETWELDQNGETIQRSPGAYLGDYNRYNSGGMYPIHLFDVVYKDTASALLHAAENAAEDGHSVIAVTKNEGPEITIYTTESKHSENCEEYIENTPLEVCEVNPFPTDWYTLFQESKTSPISTIRAYRAKYHSPNE